jgi:hypothetical protein
MDCAITAMSEGLTVQQVSKEQDFAPLRNTNSYTNLVALEQ